MNVLSIRNPALIFLLLACFFGARADDVISIDDSFIYQDVTGDNIEMLADPAGKFNFEDIRAGKYDHKFVEPRAKVPSNYIHDFVYWIRFDVQKQPGVDKDLLFEILDFRVDQYKIYAPVENGFRVLSGGDIYPFGDRKINHKNFLHNISFDHYEPETYYLRITSKESVAFVFKISALSQFVGYAVKEYSLLFLYYGILAALAVFNIILYIRTRNGSYLYYVLYVLSVALFSLSQDGTGFQYLWPGVPVINDFIFAISQYIMVIFAILYTRTFLQTKQNLHLWDVVLMVLFAGRTLMLLVALIFDYTYLLEIWWIDIVVLSTIIITGIASWRNGYSPARVFVFAFMFIFVGFGIKVIGEFGTGLHFWLFVYSFNIGFIGQVILLSVALADRVKELTLQRNKAQERIIEHLEENKKLNEAHKKELELKVKERTRELEEKNQQLDSFVYKASHDIKGPLRSIMGLTTVGSKDVQDEKAREYFSQIQKSTKRLDNTLHDLLKITRLQKAEVDITDIDFEEILSEALSTFEHDPEYSKVSFNIDIKQPELYKADPKLIRSIIQNLIENGIKYRDPDKEINNVDLKIRTSASSAEIIVSDNGLGIKEEYQDNIFKMFYRVNENTQQGSGLGLYLVKMSVEKLNGKISLKSKEGEGTTFTIRLN